MDKFPMCIPQPNSKQAVSLLQFADHNRKSYQPLSLQDELRLSMGKIDNGEDNFMKHYGYGKFYLG